MKHVKFVVFVADNLSHSRVRYYFIVFPLISALHCLFQNENETQNLTLNKPIKISKYRKYQQYFQCCIDLCLFHINFG